MNWRKWNATLRQGSRHWSTWPSFLRLSSSFVDWTIRHPHPLQRPYVSCLFQSHPRWYDAKPGLLLAQPFVCSSYSLPLTDDSALPSLRSQTQRSLLRFLCYFFYFFLCVVLALLRIAHLLAEGFVQPVLLPIKAAQRAGDAMLARGKRYSLLLLF